MDGLDLSPQSSDLLGKQAHQKTDILGNQAPENTDILGSQAPQNTDILGSQAPQNTDILSIPAPQNTDILGNQAPQNTDILGMQNTVIPEIGKQIFGPTPGNNFRGKETPDWARKLYLEPLLEGWRREVVTRATTPSDRPEVDIYYWSPEGRKLRSRPEVAEFLSDNGITKFSPVFSFTFNKRAFGKEFTPYEIVRKAGDRAGRPCGEHSYARTPSAIKQSGNKIGGKKTVKTKTVEPPKDFPFILTGDDFSPEQSDFQTNQKKRCSTHPVKKRKLTLSTTDIFDREGTPEKKYCICDGVERGQMILCDNNECEIGWYHFECVRLSEDPVGSWYCPICRGPTSDVINPSFDKNMKH